MTTHIDKKGRIAQPGDFFFTTVPKLDSQVGELGGNLTDDCTLEGAGP